MRELHCNLQDATDVFGCALHRRLSEIHRPYGSVPRFSSFYSTFGRIYAALSQTLNDESFA